MELDPSQFARQFLAKGNRVIGGVRNQDGAKHLADLGNGAVTILPLDVSSSESIAEWAAAVRRTTDHVDVLINNAGVLIYTSFDSVTAEELMACFSVNAIGPLIVAQQLHKQGLIGGREASLIGNVTSKVTSSTE